MSRHQALLLLVVLVLVPTVIYAWVYALQERPAVTQPESDLPPEVRANLDRVRQRLEALELARHEHATAPVEIVAQPIIERVEANGQDVADLMGVSLWKFRFQLPQTRYTAHLWTEHWTRKNPAGPNRVRLLMSASDEWGGGVLTIKLPLEGDPSLFIRLGDSFGENNPAAEKLQIHTPIGWASLDSQLLSPDQPVHLVTLTHNVSGSAAARLTDAHRDNDETIYLKIVFTPGDHVPFHAGRWVTGAATQPTTEPAAAQR